jgi:hypothetical protein
MTDPLTISRWGPRLARLYSEDVRKLEAKHAGQLSPGSSTWEQAVEALFHRMSDAGPVKGSKLVGKALDYLRNIDPNERAHFVMADWCGSRTALMMLASFSYGPHPDRRVKEEGLNIELHIIQCSRSKPRCAAGIPVAYISRHALNRLYERGHDICENIHAVSIFAAIGGLGYLSRWSEQHVDGGMSLLLAGLLVVGAVHRCDKTASSGRVFEETFYDVRTVLPAEEAGPSMRAQLAQGRVAAEVVEEWLRDTSDDLDEKELAARIPYLTRRADHYPLKATAVRKAAGEGDR